MVDTGALGAGVAPPAPAQEAGMPKVENARIVRKRKETMREYLARAVDQASPFA